MVDDILLTPEEQDERARKWLRDNGPALVIGIVLGLGAVFGYNQYQAKLKTDAETASAVYQELESLYEQSELAQIDELVETLKQDHKGSSYAAKAVLLRAKQLSVSDLSAAAGELQWVMDHAEELGLQHTARIRLAKVQFAAGNYEAAYDLASRKPYDGFDSHYLEILADISARRGDFELARDYYQQAADSLTSADAAYQSILTLKINRLPAQSDTASLTPDQPEQIEFDADADAAPADDAPEAPADVTEEAANSSE